MVLIKDMHVVESDRGITFEMQADFAGGLLQIHMKTRLTDKQRFNTSGLTAENTLIVDLSQIL